MAERDKEPHQPEPWKQEGRYISDAGHWTLASTKFPADARRIVAAVNAVRGIPTDALESWVVNVVGTPAPPRELDPDATADQRLSESPGSFPNDRRRFERRRGDRRAARPEVRTWESAPEPESDSSDQTDS